jgi:hypothetical protein
MDVTTLEAPLGTTATGPRSTARTTAPTRAPGRPRRRTGRGTGPQARPDRPLAGGTRVLRPQSCAVEAPAVSVAANPGWRLTERGIALVLVTGLLVVTAALTVVGLTALRVTGERYADVGQTVLVQP